jgi:carbon storage regulator CsrA
VGDVFFINQDTNSQIRVILTSMTGRQLKLGIDAPPKIKVYRGEIFDAIRAAQEQQTPQAAV